MTALSPKDVAELRADEDQMIKISKLIADLQTIKERFGDICVYIRRHGLSWGAVALNYRDDDKKHGVFDLQEQHDREMLARLEQIERLRTALASQSLEREGEKSAPTAPYLERAVIEKAHNPAYDQSAICGWCGHGYDRHFDSYDEMANVGCKYCDCKEFRALAQQPPAGETK